MAQDDAHAKKADVMVYGLALAVALVAGTVAVVSNSPWGDSSPGRPRDDAPDTAPLDPVAPASRAAAAQDTPADPPSGPSGGVEIAEPGRSRGGPDFVPSLPRVPDLANEPPPVPPAPTEVDPRMAELGAEMRVLSRARALLEDHPSEALGVLAQHRASYPEGILREEREAFTIEALVTLEHVDEAERRYYDFLVRYPESDFRARLSALMQRPPHVIGVGGGRR